jgi:hypothetical protein
MSRSDAIARISLSELQARKERDGWASDWDRVRALSEAELDLAISQDPESELPDGGRVYLPVDPELALWLEAQPGGSAAALDALLRKARARDV